MFSLPPPTPLQGDPRFTYDYFQRFPNGEPRLSKGLFICANKVAALIVILNNKQADIGLIIHLITSKGGNW